MPKEVNSPSDAKVLGEGKKRTKSVKYSETDELIDIPRTHDVSSNGDGGNTGAVFETAAGDGMNVAETHAIRQQAKGVQKKAAAQRKAFTTRQQRMHSKSISSTAFRHAFNKIRLPEEDEQIQSLRRYYELTNARNVPTSSTNYTGVIKNKKRRGNKSHVAQGLRWGDNEDESGVAVLDRNDPNYDSTENDSDCYFETTEYSLSNDQFDYHFTNSVKEYFVHQNISFIRDEFNWLNPTDAQLVRIPYLAVSLALDNKNTERELTSRLLSDLCDGTFIKHEFIANGFAYILTDQIEDLSVDVPDASDIVGKFIARAIADDVLPPAFLAHYVEVIKSGKAHDLGPKAVAAITCANVFNSRKHGIALLDDVWLMQRGECGKSNMVVPTKYLKKEFRNMLREYLYSSNDSMEVYNRLLSLNVVHYHHEFVYLCFEEIISQPNLSTMEKVDRLLTDLHNTGIVSEHQIIKGVRRIYSDLPDLCIDAPTAYLSVGRFVQAASEKGKCIPAQLVQEMPAKPKRSRFISECPVGALASGISDLKFAESPDQSNAS